MKRILAGMLGIVVLTAGAFGEPQPGGPFQNSDAVQTGFAIVNPIIGTGDGLMLFEILTYRVADTNFGSTVWPSPFITSTALVVTSNMSDQNTGIVLVNPGTVPALLTLSLRNEQGSIVATSLRTLEPLRHVSQFVSELFAGQPNIAATGLLSIDSTSPIVVAGLLFQGPEFSFLPTTATGVFAFPGNLLIPQFAVGGGWSTQIVIANQTGLDQVVRINFHESSGRVIASVPNVNIRAAGVVVISPDSALATTNRP
jgi:hypothetical protein